MIKTFIREGRHIEVWGMIRCSAESSSNNLKWQPKAGGPGRKQKTAFGMDGRTSKMAKTHSMISSRVKLKLPTGTRAIRRHVKPSPNKVPLGKK